MSETIVSIRDLAKTFRREDGSRTRAIDGVSLDVQPGEFVVLLGPSGCGKTTLLRSIAGLEQPDSGAIDIRGETVFSSERRIDVPPERRRLAMIFQSYALWPHMTAFENVAYPLQNRRLKKQEIRDRVERVFELVSIPELQRQYPGQLSGGQQQRVALARALVGGGDLVLFDEPLSNVDAKVREQLRFELLSMQRELGFAAIYVTHDQTEAMELGHRVAVMREGQVAQIGPPQEIYLQPRSRYVANFVGSANELLGTVRSVTGAKTVVETDLGDLHGVAAEEVAVGDEVAAVCRPERVQLLPDRAGLAQPLARRSARRRLPRREPGARRSCRRTHIPALERRHEATGRRHRDLAIRRSGARAGTAEVKADFDPLAPETFDSFHREFAELRERCPVAHSDAYNGFWALTRYEDVVMALRDPNFTTTVQNVVPKLAFTGRRPPLHLDPPEHTPYRVALNPYFTAEKMTRIEPKLREVIGGLLEPIVAAGGGDICEGFSYRLPGYVFAEFFNLPAELGLRIREASREFNVAVQDFVEEDVKRTSMQLYDIARTIIDMRKAQPLDPADDPATGLLQTGLPEDMLLGTIRQFIVVGMIAPSVFIGSMVIHLAQHRDVQQQLREDPSLIPSAVEEYLRLLTPYRGFARTAKQDVEIRGRTIRKDEPIALVFASANRDEDVFPEGDRFILDRPNIKRHLAFGMGPHRCAGAPLGTLMLRLTLEELLSRTSRIDVIGDPTMTRWPEWGTLAVQVRLG